MEYRLVPICNDARVIENDYLCCEGFHHCRRCIDRTANISSLDIILGYSSHVKTDVIAWFRSLHGLVMHFNGLYLAVFVSRKEYDLVTDLQNTSLNSANRYCSNTGNGINILYRESQRLVCRFLWYCQIVECLQKCWSLVPHSRINRTISKQATWQ